MSGTKEQRACAHAHALRPGAPRRLPKPGALLAGALLGCSLAVGAQSGGGRAATTPPPSPTATPIPAPSSTLSADLPRWCKAIGERLGSLTLEQCLGTGLLAGDGRSVQGTALWMRDVLPAKGPARLRVLVLGGIHGDEITSVSLVFDWIARALKTTDEPIHWRMVPLVNPDGLLRKPSTRVNSRGVDLNRNFSTMDWASDAQSYWVGRTGRDPRRYPGNKAMSEPETQWVQKQVELFRPNLIVSVHAPYGLLDFDGPPPVPDKLGSLYLDQIGVYPGSLGNYAGVVRQVPVVTLELKNARSVSSNEVGAMWSDLRGWIDRRLINVAQQGSGTEGNEPAARLR